MGHNLGCQPETVTRIAGWQQNGTGIPVLFHKNWNISCMEISAPADADHCAHVWAC